MKRWRQALAAVAAAAWPASAPVAAQPPVRETLDVVELSVLADVPLRRGTLGWDAVGIEDIELYEDGVRREVTQLEEGPARGSWRVLVWIDGERCDAARLRADLRALGASHGALAELGPPLVVVADPRPRALGTPQGEEVWRAWAADVGHGIGCRDAPREASDRLRRAGRTADALAAGLDGDVERNDALLRYAGSATAGGPAVLVLLSRGYDLRPQLRWTAAERPPGSPTFEARGQTATEDLGRGLAEGGWTVVVPAMPPPRVGAVAQAMGDTVPSAPPSPLPPMVRAWPPRSRGQLRPPEAYDVFLDFTLEPWRRVADLTAGGVAGSAGDLAATLGVVADLRRVWYRSSRPAPGESRQLRLLLRKSDGQPVRAPARLPARWSSAPLAAARLRSGEAGGGAVPWRLERAGDRWRVTAIADLAVPRAVRWGVAVGGSPEFQAAYLGREATLPAAGEVAAGAVLYLEDLETGAWIVSR